MGMESAFPALVQWERTQRSLSRGAQLIRLCVELRCGFSRPARPL
jgi:hypothetical protein